MSALSNLRSLMSDALSAEDSEKVLSKAGLNKEQALRISSSPAFRALKHAKAAAKIEPEGE